MRISLWSLIICFLTLSACRKTEIITTDTNAKLSFSSDSILFDTVFTSIGSTSRKLQVFNYNKNALSISEIKLAGGSNSPFSININGQSLLAKNNVKLNGNDSLNIFIKVTINPNLQDAPFIVQDSIICNTNGNRQVIQLVAYGQNAIFINNGTINANTTWTKGSPYIIYQSVTVANGATLNIEPGAKIYFHKDAKMNIEGTLIAKGTVQDSIVFSSDRLERLFQDEPGQWEGLHFKAASTNSIIENALIKNGIVGITSDSLSNNSNPKLLINGTIIKNMQVAGYIGYHSDLMAFNSLIHNCGSYLLYAVGGGNYNLKQNTFAAYNFNFARKTPALLFSDILNTTRYNNLNVDLVNNIIWGSLTNELVIEKKSTATVQNHLLNNLIKSNQTSFNNNGNILNVDPQFLQPRYGIYTLLTNSPAENKGTDLTADPFYLVYLKRDMKNNLRLSPSTIGCYENN